MTEQNRAASSRALLLDAATRASNYLEGLDTRAVGADPQAVERLAKRINQPLPRDPQAAEAILAMLDEFASPATVGSAGGRYFGFVTGGSLPVALAAQYLAAAWDQNSFSYLSSPAVAVIEETALQLTIEALGLPATGGAFVTGATMANFTCLAAARNTVLSNHGWDVDRDGLFGAPEISVVVGEECHATLFKVLAMLGLGRDRVIRVPVDAEGRMRADRLPDISGPTIVCVQSGNVNSGAFDPVAAVSAVVRPQGAWVHVDGAFGLWAQAHPDLAALTQGVEDADSWATDCHKWLNVPYDCGAALVRDNATLAAAMSISGAYIPPSDKRDAFHYTPDSSRRARAVEVWAALMGLGKIGLADLIARNCRQARQMAVLLRDAGIEIMNEVELNQIVVSFGSDARTQEVIVAVQNDGTCWCGGTNWRGRNAMRISVSSWATTDDDINAAAQAIIRIASSD
jgi:glutamate/tyrosine decarboxylase-like PLP-dependent enzyme